MDVGAVYRSESEALFRYLVRMTGDPDVAADVLQDTFFRLVEQPPRTTENLRGWLFKVATNRLRDHARKRKRQAALVGQGVAGDSLGDPPPPPDRVVAGREGSTAVRKALECVPLRDRTILLMREEGFRHWEIAQAVGTTTGSVGTLIARALDRVKRELEADHG